MSAESVILDPKELRLFASRLKQFNITLSQSSQQLHAQFKQLGETWRDPAYAKFAQQFQETMRNLQAFERVADETVPRLLKTAEKAESVHR